MSPSPSAFRNNHILAYVGRLVLSHWPPGMPTQMMETASPTQRSVLTADYVNPVLGATKSVFERMLSCSPTRKSLGLKEFHAPRHEVSAVIGISGRVQGTICLCLSTKVACGILERMIGLEATEVTPDVCDAVGELTNMIAGAAKAQLAKYDLSISLPNVMSGSGHVVHFPSDIQPLIISFESEIGPFTVEVGFCGI